MNDALVSCLSRHDVKSLVALEAKHKTETGAPRFEEALCFRSAKSDQQKTLPTRTRSPTPPLSVSATNLVSPACVHRPAELLHASLHSL